MSTFALIHGAGVGGGWYWHLVEAELRALGHATVAPTLWTGDDSATLSDYADAVVDAIDAIDAIDASTPSTPAGRRSSSSSRIRSAGSPHPLSPNACLPPDWSMSPPWSRGPTKVRTNGGATRDTRRLCESRLPKTAA
jgi:hypothetical protein